MRPLGPLSAWVQVGSNGRRSSATVLVKPTLVPSAPDVLKLCLAYAVFTALKPGGGVAEWLKAAVC